MFYSKKTEIAKSLAQSDRVLTGPDLWTTIDPNMRLRYRKYVELTVQELRNPTSAQVERAAKRYPDVSVAAIRQIWKDMIDDLIERK